MMRLGLNFKRFNELTEEDFHSDCHMHTSWTDGKNKVEEMVNQAKKIGLKSIAFTEHVDERTDWFPEFKK